MSIVELIRYSNFPVINLPFKIESIFIKPTNSDGIFFNLAIGYIVSALFYFMMVYYPDRVRKEKVTKVALSEVSTVCTDAMLLIVHIYKNVSLITEWDFKNLSDDELFIDENFYSRMRRFDVYKTADTLLCHDEEPYNIITWDEKLFNDFEDYVKRIDATLDRYLHFLDEKLIDTIMAFQKNLFITTYLGLPSNNIGLFYSGKNGKKYLDRVPLHTFLNDRSGKKAPIFGTNDNCDNNNLLTSYVDTLMNLRKYCYTTIGFRKNAAVKLLCEGENGQYGIAIYNTDGQ